MLLIYLVDGNSLFIISSSFLLSFFVFQVICRLGSLSLHVVVIPIRLFFFSLEFSLDKQLTLPLLCHRLSYLYVFLCIALRCSLSLFISSYISISLKTHTHTYAHLSPSLFHFPFLTLAWSLPIFLSPLSFITYCLFVRFILECFTSIFSI